MTTDRLARFRERKDHYFAHGDNSPIPEEERERFPGLSYYPENPALALTLPLETDGPGVGERLTLATSDGQPLDVVRAGRIRFAVDDRPVELTVFKDIARGRYFLPFRDATAGDETYPVGRYLDPQARPDGTLVVDFNYAYNPYCAYSDGWHCPIPPRENVVPVPIPAGEKAYHPPEPAEPAPVDAARTDAARS